jgi:hypothetical protein
MTETNRTTGRRAPARGDVTALQQATLDEARDTEQKEAAAEKKRAREVEDYQKKHEVIDYTGADVPLPEPEKADVEDEPYQVVTMKYDVEQMAYGREIHQDPEYDGETGEMTKAAVLGGIRFLNFAEGRRYNVPTPLAQHLDERGLLWH